MKWELEEYLLFAHEVIEAFVELANKHDTSDEGRVVIQSLGLEVRQSSPAEQPTCLELIFIGEIFDESDSVFSRQISGELVMYRKENELWRLGKIRGIVTYGGWGHYVDTLYDPTRQKVKVRVRAKNFAGGSPLECGTTEI